MLSPSVSPRNSDAPPGVGRPLPPISGLGAPNGRKGLPDCNNPIPTTSAACMNRATPETRNYVSGAPSLSTHRYPPRKDPRKPRLQLVPIYINYKSTTRVEPTINAGGARKPSKPTTKTTPRRRKTKSPPHITTAGNRPPDPRASSPASRPRPRACSSRPSCS